MVNFHVGIYVYGFIDQSSTITEKTTCHLCIFGVSLNISQTTPFLFEAPPENPRNRMSPETRVPVYCVLATLFCFCTAVSKCQKTEAK